MAGSLLCSGSLFEQPAIHIPDNRMSQTRRSIPSIVSGVLELIQAPVDPAFAKQFLVRAGFPQLSFMENKDAVRPLNGREPVRDDQARAPFDQTVKRFPDA